MQWMKGFKRGMSLRRMFSGASLNVSSMYINYGSTSGNATLFSTMLADQADDREIPVAALQSMEEISDFSDLIPVDESELPVILISVFGEGEPPDSARRTFEWWTDPQRQQDQILKDRMKNRRYAMFGLGHSGYATERYNCVAKQLDQALSSLGAERLGPLGLGDAAGTLDDDFDEWSANLWKEIDAQSGVSTDEQEAAKESIPKTDDKNKIIMKPNPSLTGFYRPFDGHTINSDNPFWATVSSVRNLHSEKSDRVCQEVVMSADFPYTTGGYAGVWAKNSRENVNNVLDLMGYTGDETFHLQGYEKLILSRRKQFPYPITVREFLRTHCNLHYPLRSGAMRALSRYVDPQFKELIQEALDDEAVYTKHFKHKNVGQVLRESGCTNNRLTLEQLLSFIPPSHPTYYSIASSPLVMPGKLRLVVMRHKFQGEDTDPQYGFCSQFLTSRKPGKTINVFPKDSAFYLPRDQEKTPIVCVGAGSGIAPFTAFFEERAFLMEQGKSLAPCVFYYGCEHPEVDYALGEELTHWEARGVLRVVNSFNQVTPGVFAQHRMEEEGHLVWDLLHNRHGHLYVCGHQRLGEGVNQALVNIAGKHLETSLRRGDLATTRARVKDPERWYNEFVAKGSYKYDVFA